VDKTYQIDAPLVLQISEMEESYHHWDNDWCNLWIRYYATSEV